MNGSVKPVALAVLNFRMGGQLSSLIALSEELRLSGICVRILLPYGVSDLTKTTLAAFGCRSIQHRMRAMLTVLRQQAKRDNELLHLVLPSPGFAMFARFCGLDPDRTLLQWEGFPIRFNREFLAAFRSDPLFLLPRIVLNHQSLHWLARLCPYHQLVTTPHYSEWLVHRGHRDVDCIPNLARVSGEDFNSPSVELRAFLEEESVLIGYIGHAHPVKGIDDLIDAFVLAWNDRPKLRLLLALSPDGDAQRIVRRLEGVPQQARHQILLTGTVPIGCVLRRVDALALPYRSLISTTLLPSLLLEADAAGCPVILSDLPEFAEIVPRRNESWHMTPPEDVAKLAETIRHLPSRPAQHIPLQILPTRDRISQLIQVYKRIASDSQGD